MSKNGRSSTSSSTLAPLALLLAISGVSCNFPPPPAIVDASPSDAANDAPIDDALLDAAVDASSGPIDAPSSNCSIAPVCASPVDLGSITADPHGTPTPYPVQVSHESNGGEPAWYRVRLMDTLAPGNLTAGVELMMSGTNYDMRVYCALCGGQLADIGEQVGATREIAFVRRDDTASLDDFDILIEVKRSPGATGCGPYQLIVAGNQGVGAATCN